jgi:DNA-binding NarL/FixJ family response regulator
MAHGGEPMTITVAIVDDDDLATSAIVALLAPCTDVVVLATARSVDEVIAMHNGKPPDVVLLDVILDRRNSPLAANVARLRQWGAQVLAISSQPDRREVAEAVRRQRLNFLPKHDLHDRQVFIGAIRSTAAGVVALSPQFIQEILLKESQGTPKLTPQETEVMRLSASGRAPKQIAKRLGIREDTVRKHLKSILAKYDDVGRPIDNPVKRHYAALHDEIITDLDDVLGDKG